jgi:uncharacterized SAM-binding protein YcdF (DUF218 family)
MFGALKSFIGVAVMPVPVAVAMGLVGLLLIWRRQPRVGVGLIVAAAALVTLLSWAPVADRLLGPIERAHAPLLDARVLDQVDAIVVLSAGWSPDERLPITSQLNTSTLVRLSEGIRLWQQRPEARLVVTGGSRDPYLPGSALGMAAAARALGVNPDRIVALDGPLDTAQEAQAVRAALGLEMALVVVTSASHMQRAMWHFERVGFAAMAAPTGFKVDDSPRRFSDYVPSSQHLRKSERAIYERLGRVSLAIDH